MMTTARTRLAALILAPALAAAMLSPLPALAGGKGCPPGLAKKAVPCVPPGQAKKWVLGERLPTGIAWYEVTDWDRYGLSNPPAGYRYIRVDNEVLLTAIATGVVMQSLGLFNF
jgi:hypothetical protein